MLMDHVQAFADDSANGKFDGRFEALTTGSGVHIPDMETALDLQYLSRIAALWDNSIVE